MTDSFQEYSMLKHKSFIFLCLIALLVSGCSQSNDKATDLTSEEKAIDFGKFESGVYTNKYFNLKVSIPETWSVIDDETRIELMRQGAKVVAGDDKNLKALMDATDLANINMLTVSRFPLGSPVQSNPTFIVIAEKVKHLPGIKRGSDYYFHTRKAMEASKVNVSFPREVHEETISGVPFDVLDMEMSMGDTKIYQSQYGLITKGYVVIVALTYTEPGELNELRNILSTITMDI